MVPNDAGSADLPDIVREYIDCVTRKMRYRRRVREEVRQELVDHFTDALADCKSEQERQQRAERLIAEFGDAKMLAVLIRRGKKRCRPPWAKALVHTGQAMLGVIVLFCLYTAWFLSGGPTVRVDYLAELNRLVRLSAPQEQNAWPYYARAAELYVEPKGREMSRLVSPWDDEGRRKAFGRLSESDRRRILQWVEQNGTAWEQFVAGSRRPFCWREVKTHDERFGMLGIVLPHLSPLRGLSRVGIWRARIAAHQGDLHRALEECLVVARAARHWQGKGRFLIEQLIGIAMATGAYREIRYIIRDGRISADHLASLQAALRGIYPEGYPLIDLETERLFFLDTVQRVFTEGGPGGGHLVPSEFMHLVNMVGGDIPQNTLQIGLLGMLHARRNETLAVGSRIYAQIIRRAGMSPYERRTSGGPTPDDLLEKISLVRFFVLRILLPSIDKAGEMAFRGKAEYEATLTVLALRRWRIEKGTYPNSLNDLVAAGYLKRLPADPYSDGALRYAARGNDFNLFSVGANFVDDGGVGCPGDAWGSREKGCDHVFWPPP